MNPAKTVFPFCPCETKIGSASYTVTTAAGRDLFRSQNAQAVHGLSPPDSPAFRVKNAPRRVPVIGLVGGIGSGKSYLARLLRKKHPIEIVEGDAAGHQVLQEPSVKESVRKAFGDAVFTSGGEVDRSRVKELVFGPGPEHKAALKKLEQIVHPRITEILTRQVAQAQSRGDVEAVVLDAALVLEAGWRSLCDTVVFVDTPLDERLARVMKSRGWSRNDLRFREESQFPVERKRKEAEYVVENTGDGQAALSQLEEIYSRVLSRRHP
jgi:dephospho-CoA kinase